MRFANIICLASLVAGTLNAASLNGLYFGLDNMRGFSEVYWWFLPDGRVLRNVLPSSIDPSSFNAACQAHSGSCGTYTLSGDKMTIQDKDGKPQNWTYKVLNGGIQLNYLIMTPVGKYAAGAHLNGTWSRASSNKFAGTNSTIAVTSPSFYTFKSDGTFQLKSITGLETQSSVKGASVTNAQESGAGGTYSIHDNVLALVKSGKSEQHMIFPVAGDNLNIDGLVYTKQK